MKFVEPGSEVKEPFKFDSKKIKLFLLKYTSYGINLCLVLAVLGIVAFFVWGLIMEASTPVMPQKVL